MNWNSKSIAIDKQQEEAFSNKMRFMNLLMVLLVVAMHISYNSGRWDFITKIMKYSSSGAMGWFFFMSAFWYFREYNYDNAWTKFKKRIKTLLVPYIMWNTILFLIRNSKAIFAAGSFAGFEKGWLLSLTFTRLNGLGLMPIDGPTWYIIRLLSYFLMSPLMYFCIKDKRAGIISIIVCFIMTRNGQYYNFDGWLCLFMVGAYVGLHYREEYVSVFTRFQINNSNKILGVIGVILGYMLLSFIWFICVKYGLAQKLWTCFHYFISYLIAAIPLLFFDVLKLKPEVSGYSFGLYCAHMVFVPVFNKVFSRINALIQVAGGPWAIILLLSISISVVVLCKVLHRISPRCEALFTGGR